MIWGTLKPQDPVTVSPDKIILHGLRDSDGPSRGEPIRMTLDAAEAMILMEGLQKILKDQIVPPDPVK